MIENLFNIISDYVLAPVVGWIVPEGYADYTLYTLEVLVKILAILLPLLLVVAYLTYAERKIIGFIQCRLGPNRVGFFGFRLWGLGQPIADVVKLIFKEIIIPTGANKRLFVMAPVLAMAPSLAAWAVIPFGDTLVLADINAGLLYILALTSLAVYGIIVAGWASNSKYAFLGAMRSAAQIVSYEIAMGFALVCVLIAAGSLNLGQITAAQSCTGTGCPCCPFSWFTLFPAWRGPIVRPLTSQRVNPNSWQVFTLNTAVWRFPFSSWRNTPTWC